MSVGEPNTNKTWPIAMRTMGIASAWIVGPVLLGLVIGKWLDRKYSSDPWLLIISLAFFFVISMFGIVKNAMKEFKKIEEEAKKNQE
ncbi:MAG: AtpZ/AtpI family protein [Patescibacteria group bacterium]